MLHCAGAGRIKCKGTGRTLAHMRADQFVNSPTGVLVPVSGTSPRWGSWEHVAFVPHALPGVALSLSAETYGAVAQARAALAALDSTAVRLPNPSLLRRPALRQEAQSTSALEGTYAPLEDVLAADVDEKQPDLELREVLNYVRAADHAFAWLADGRPLTVGLLVDLQARLVAGTAADDGHAGRLRDIQVAIGAGVGAHVRESRFVPRPPGPAMEAQVRDLVDWMSTNHGRSIDPVAAAGMAHYQFETLHPFNDGNGRIGRLLVVLDLLRRGVLTEPTLTISPWFEARRADYYDSLLAVSARGDWDRWLSFFADGLSASARSALERLTSLLAVQEELKTRIRASGLRANSAVRLIDFVVGQPIFTVRQVERHLELTYARANGLVGQLVTIGVLRQYDAARYGRRFTAPEILAVLLRTT